MANQDILINWAPQETRVAVVENGAVQELHIERTLERGLVGNVYLGKVTRVLPGMQSAFIDIGLDRAAFLHVADLNPPANGSAGGIGARGEAAATPIERQVFEGQSLTVQVIKDPIGSKGARLSAQVSIAGRMLVFLPHDRHIGISQKIGPAEAREQLRTRMQALAGEQTGRLHPAHQCRGRQRRRTGRRHRLPAHYLGAHPRACPGFAAGYVAASGPEPGRARAARPEQRGHADHPHRLGDAVRQLEEVRRRLHAAQRGQARSLSRRAADLRPVRHRGRDCAGAVAPRRVEERRHAGHRPDRGDDDDRRQHRRLRRRTQLRGHGVQDQPRSRRRHRPPVATAQPGWHGHRRLHRHGARGAPGRGAGANSASNWRATARAPR